MSSTAARPASGGASRRPRVVVVGGGFGGLRVVRELARAPVDVTLVDRRNHHLFQPLLYEVATAALSPGDIAEPLRRILRGQANASVLLGEVSAVDLEARTVTLAESPSVAGTSVDYDVLVLATGSTHHYFGNDPWARFAPGLKTVEDAVAIRRDFLLAFERAERSKDPVVRERQLTTVIVGGGPTGLELAGTMSEVARHVLYGEFRHLDPASLRLVLAEGGERLLPALPPALGERAKRQLERLGVEVRLATQVTEIDADGVVLHTGERIDAANVVWAAGVCGAPVGRGLEASTRSDRRLDVRPDLTLEGHPEVFAIGDLAHVETDGEQVPGLAPAAMQMGQYVGRMLSAEFTGRKSASDREPFRYRDKGTLATIGRGKAVAHVGGFEFGGKLAWFLWVFVHIFFLVGYRNRLRVLIEWGFAYLTFQRGARLITGEQRFVPPVAEHPAAAVSAANAPAASETDAAVAPDAGPKPRTAPPTVP